MEEGGERIKRGLIGGWRREGEAMWMMRKERIQGKDLQKMSIERDDKEETKDDNDCAIMSKETIESSSRITS